MIVTLQWKEFFVPINRLLTTLKGILSSNFDGLVCRNEDFDVVFLNVISEEDQDNLLNFWNTLEANQFDPSLREILSQKINEASAFGRSVILDAAVENVEMDITQAGKTRDVANYCANVQRFLESGSLYAAVAEIDDMLNAGVPESLAPFVTSDRLIAYKNKINTYLES